MKLLIILTLLLSFSLQANDKAFTDENIDDLCQAIKDNNIGNVASIMWKFGSSPFPALVDNYEKVKCSGDDGIKKELLIFAIDEQSLDVLNHIGEQFMEVPTEESVNIVNRAHDYLNKRTQMIIKAYQVFSNLGTKADDIK